MENNNKFLIVKILGIVLIISALIVVVFLLNKEKEIILSPEDIKVKESMLQWTFVAERFKENYGYYNDSDRRVNVDFCELKESNFAGVGNGHILCSNVMNRVPGKISIKMNDNTEDTSKYCIAKELSMGKFWCIDYDGYFDVASTCGDDYKCKK